METDPIRHRFFRIRDRNNTVSRNKSKRNDSSIQAIDAIMCVFYLFSP